MALDLTADIIDISDAIERFEELSEERTDSEEHEFELLTELLNEIGSRDGNVQWRGDWYPSALIADSYFEEHARELADDLYDVDAARWPFNCIDWERAARELRSDYSTVDVDGISYWYR